MFPENNYFKQFMRKTIIKMEEFLLCVHKIENKDEDYMQVAYLLLFSALPCR